MKSATYILNKHSLRAGMW